MGILIDGFRKQKRYTTNANGDHQLVSTWTHSDTVIMPDGTPLSEAVLGDGNDAVKQTETVDGNDNYEILLSQTADDTTRTEGARKSSKLKFNPYTSSLMMATRNGQSTLTPNQLTISGVGGEGSLTNNTLVLSNNGISTTYSNSDIVTDNHNTWDGTNTSLKAAVTNAKGTVTQTETTTSGNYELLFSGTGDDTTRTEGAKKSTYLKFNPTNKSLNIVNEYNDTNYKSVAVTPTGVNVLSAKNGVHNLNYTADDIVFNAPSNPPTWDGTNTSLKAAIAAAAGAGGSEAVYLPLADYEELTTAEKEDPTKIYFVINEGTKVSPVLSGADSRISQSSQSGDPSGGWRAFDGVKDTDNHIEHSWQPWGNNGGEWISCSFDTAQNFSKIVIDAMVNMNTGASNTFTYWVEGSNDGETWDNILLNGETISITYNGRGYTNWKEDTILLNCPKKYNKIRLRMDKSIGYQYSYCSYWLTEFEIYAAAASNKPSIYYKNVLYTPDELPATTISDAGKILKVNEDGLWDKGDAPIPNINSVQVPPVIFDNGSLKKVNDVDGFPGLEKVFLTPTGYEALTQAEKEDLSKIYYVSEYDYYNDKGGTLVLRVKNDEIKLFVNGFVDENTDLEDGNFVGIINDKIRELKGSYFIGSIAYNENKEPIGGSLPYVYIDANYSRIAFRNASGDSSHVINTTTYAVIDLTNYSHGSVLQSNPWEDPYDISGGMTIYYGGKQYTEYEPAKPYVELTQAEYDALPSSKESDGIIYFING